MFEFQGTAHERRKRLSTGRLDLSALVLTSAFRGSSR